MKVVLPNPQMRGLHHVSAGPINKYDLLQLVAAAYGKHIDIVADASVVIDRSLVSTRFREQTGYAPPPWPQLVQAMRSFG